MPRGDRCKVCRSSQRALIDTLLLAGHDQDCIVWHLIRIGQRLPHTSIESHCEVHLGGAVPQGRPWVGGWHFTPYTPPPVCPGILPELLLIRGLPSVGKTELARTYGATHAHVEADLFFADQHGYFSVKRDALSAAHDWCQAWVTALLRTRHNVVVSNTFSQQWEMVVYLTLAIQCGATVRVLELREVLTQPRLPHLVNLAGRMRNRWEPSPVPSEVVSRPVMDMPLAIVPYACQPGLCELGPPYLSAS